MKINKIVAAVAISFFICTANAQENSDRFYYQIGGGQLSDSSLKQWNEFNLDLNAYASGNYSCGDFDLEDSIKALIKNINDVPDEFEAYLEVAALDLLQGLIALAIQKAAPGAYEYLTNAYARHKEFLQLSLASCQNIEKRVQNGEISDFQDLAKLIEWRKGAEEGKPVQEAQAEATGRSGIPWVNGENRGGEGQEPIKLVKDSVERGYELLVGDSANGDGDSNIQKEFPTKEDAAEWAKSVYGEKEISFVNKSASTSGSGMVAEIAIQTDEIKQTLERVIKDPFAANSDDFEVLSAPDFGVTPSGLSAINAQEKDRQRFITKKLASEISTYKTIEKAYMIRSFLVAAMDDPNFYFNDVMPKNLDRFVKRIDDGINVAQNRIKIRNEIIGKTMTEVINSTNDTENRVNDVLINTNQGTSLPDGTRLKSE